MVSQRASQGLRRCYYAVAGVAGDCVVVSENARRRQQFLTFVEGHDLLVVIHPVVGAENVGSFGVARLGSVVGQF